MRSFGLWYKSNENGENEPVFSVHINFWSESVKNDKSKPDLDVGLKIQNFRRVDEARFHCPFVVEDNEVVDLVPTLLKIENANIIFNTDGSIQAKESYSVYSFEKENEKENLLLFPLNQDLEKIYFLEPDDEKRKTDIVFNFAIFNAYLNQKNEFAEIKDVYIRLRITSSELKNSIYFDCEPSNKSFESAFSGTRIFDFKINEKRNLGIKTIKNVDLNKYIFPEIKTVHLLIMEPSSYDVESFADKQMTCRELEGDLWNDYFKNEIDYSQGRILAYHWKFEGECSCLVKVKYSKTNLRTLSAYILVVLALGMLGSFAVTMLQAVSGNDFVLISIIIGVILFVGFLLGKKK